MCEACDRLVSSLTDYELDLIHRRLWREMIDATGYQPFGHDRRTLHLTGHSDWLGARDAIVAEIQRRSQPEKKHVAANG